MDNSGPVHEGQGTWVAVAWTLAWASVQKKL